MIAGTQEGNSVDLLSARLAAFTANFRMPSEGVSHATKIAILDCLGVAVLATSEEIGKKLMLFVRDNVAPGSCSFWGLRATGNVRDAAFVNGILGHGLDYDDRHTSSCTLASTIAVSEQSNASGFAALEGFIVGREVKASLDVLFRGRSGGVGPGARGWQPNGILGSISSACAASKVLGFDEQQVLTALGLAAGSCGALARDGGTMAKPYRVGHAAVTGVTCALLAKAGFTSDRNALEGCYGLLDALGPLKEELLNSLGKELGVNYHLATANAAIKRYPSCTATHAAIDAMLKLTQRRNILPAEVDVIECDLRTYPALRIFPSRGLEGRFSVAFCLAIALIDGKVVPESFRDERVQEPTVRDLIQRTRNVSGSKDLSVNLKDGTKLLEPLLPAEDLVGWDAVVAKFHRCTSGILSESKRSDVIQAVRQLETLPSIGILTETFRH